MTDTQNHSLRSSHREALLEHLFAGEIMKRLWLRGDWRLEVLKPQVDDSGYDLVLAMPQGMSREREGLLRLYGAEVVITESMGGMDEAVAAARAIADERGVSPQRVALAWELALSPVVIPIPGASRPETIRDSAQAPALELSEDEMARLNA